MASLNLGPKVLEDSLINQFESKMFWITPVDENYFNMTIGEKYEGDCVWATHVEHVRSNDEWRIPVESVLLDDEIISM